MKNKVQLITYPDSLGGNISKINVILMNYFQDVFEGGVHILPPFPSSGDRGFAPTTYFEINPAFGNWQDITRIGKRFDLMVDVMVNHISRFSKYFQDFLSFGRKSEYADMFLTLDKIWPDGNPLQEDIDKIFLRKPEHPFLNIQILETGEIEKVWTSFGPRVDYSEQMDLDVNSPVTRAFFVRLLNFLGAKGVKNIRIDAVGYVIKKPGTSCFMVEPEIYEFLDWLTGHARDAGIELLAEVHDHYTTQFRLAEQGYWVYNFVLPMLILHSLTNHSSKKLKAHLKICPRKQITMLDCHDGIPVQPDMDDILTVQESKRIVDLCIQRGANLNRIISELKNNTGFDTHQINITYFDALDRDDDAYLAARAIQFFSPGIPQVYYVGLLAGENDLKRYNETGEGREINRHNFTIDEIEKKLETQVVQRLLKLCRFRNNFAAFDGEIDIMDSIDSKLSIRWQKNKEICQLNVDLESFKTEIQFTNQNGKWESFMV
ncbi:MAG: sucrose phosphorylase [Anaerolineaceae bacterium]|nr:sucrose phosphorylase [Anaerolineaceae bacterium]